MGFSSALQGRAAHEALIMRQDAELRLMETMKRSIQMKAKCDKEYAISLAAMAQQGLKIDRADELQGSMIAKSWRSYMEELDQQAKQFKSNAELLEVVCEKLAHLSQDKRKARKSYQEEHAKIAARLNHLADEVVRKKSEYQKHLEGYKALRTRFEEYYIKSGRGGRKLDDVRDKYQKACRKLHLTHNEYVLSITEAIEVEKDFRTVLLPGLLEHQQSVQESFILLWKNILQEAIQYGDLTSEKFKEIQNRIDIVINNINPNEEYREFTEKHKTSPTTQLVFQFDEALIEDIPGKLQSNTLTVDNLTVDWLRTRLLDLEISVKECQERQIKMIEQVNGGSPIVNGSIITNGSTNTNTNGTHNSKESHKLPKDLNALRCQEKQKQKLVDMIRCALNEVGCEELPSGCDDHLALEQNFIENSFNNEQQKIPTSNASTSSASVSIMNELMRRGGVFTLLRGRHFKRKSTPQPTTPTARARTQRQIKLQSRSQSLGSLSVNSSPARYEPITNPLRMAVSVEVNHIHGLHTLVDLESVIVFDRNNEPVQKFLPKLRRTQLSLLCLNEDESSPLQSPTNNAVIDTLQSSLAKRFHTNNNNVYADLELGPDTGMGAVDCERESVKSGELAVKRQQNVKIEINRVDSGVDCNCQRSVECKETEQPPVGGIRTDDANICESFLPQIEASVTASSLARPLEMSTTQRELETATKSIDAHLDRIDELNRSLDDRLRRNLPLLGSPSNVNFDAIEVADPNGVPIHPNKDDNDNGVPDVSGSKRTSSSDYRLQIGIKDNLINHNNNNICINGNNKKRSLSFSQKSINAIFTNIKEFSRSPLARIHKTNHNHNATLIEANDPNTICSDNNDETIVETTQFASNNDTPTSSNNTHSNHPSHTNDIPKITNAMANTNTSTHINEDEPSAILHPPSKDNVSAASHNRLKFKVPKIKKKSKAIRNTFRSKLMNFQIKRGKLCKTCTKRRRIHPSKTVLDFTKEFKMDTGSNGGMNNEEFCTCPDEIALMQRIKMSANASTNTENAFESITSAGMDDDESSDDVLSMKDHCYCVPSLATSMSLSTNRPLYEEEWFHGVLPREEVVRLLNNDGDFLVRETIRNEESQIVLSVCWFGHKHFIVQTTVDGHFRFEGPPFPSIQELIMHQYHSELPVTVKSGAILRRPICRERWELSNDDVVLLEKIGRGNFGDVYKAKLKSTKQDVAVKTCRMTLPEEQKRKFLQEGRILKQYDHPNIVKLIGICVQKQPIMIVMELVPGGSLLNYLRKNSNGLNTRQQMGMCRDAAAGMRYLESKNCIHRDLAARNCLVDFENSVKISDFGMSREEEEYIVSDGMKQIPVKWTAPEALNFGKYTSLCDVWSYGILMWEIFSKGDTPYAGMSNSRARERIDTGYRMPAPEFTPPEMYRLMLKCWAAEPESRPHFDEIFNVVDALIIRLDNSQ